LTLPVIPYTTNNMASGNHDLQGAFVSLYDIICHLRGPDGCPWDREQTPDSMRANLVEETYECVEAIDEKDPAHLREELGDLFLILILITRMNEETGSFTLEEVLREISAKLVRRHPHVFDGKKDASIPEILKNWDYIKEHIEGKKKKEGVHAEITNALPPLDKAHTIQKKAAKVGFDWPSAQPVFAKLEEETRELEEALQQNDQSRVEDEVGDMLFTLVNLARHLRVDPSLAIERTNRKFISRFRRMESYMKETNLSFSQTTLAELDALWEKAKRETRTEHHP
jgi:tetrapyrrole methylase family protein/MazG family protein